MTINKFLTVVLIVLVTLVGFRVYELRAAYTTQEDERYAFQAAMLDPRVIHYKTGSFSFTTTEPIYATQKNLVRYGGLTNDYVDSTSFLKHGENVTYFPTNTTITGLNDYAFMVYVNVADIQNITNPKELYYKRMNYIQNTTPTFYKVENIQPGRNSGYTSSFNVGGAIGALVKTVQFQGYQWSLKASDGTTERNIIPGYGIYVGNNAYWGHNWHNRDLYLPIKGSVDGTNYTYRGYATSDDSPFTAHVILEVFDALPSDW